MATNMQIRTRAHSLGVQKARAEERKQRLEERWYELEVKNSEREDRKQELEQDQLLVDLAKHFTTVVTALLFILAYFSGDIIPFWKETVTILGFSFWDIAVMALAFSFGLSLVVLIYPIFPGEFNRQLAKGLLAILALLMILALAVVIVGLRALQLSP